MYATKDVFKILFGLCIIIFLPKERISAQVVIGTPNLGFSQACASESFNTFSATFVFSPESALEPSNQFSVELSDADGDFANSVIVMSTAPGSVTQSPATLEFSLPEDTSGENYRIRIRSSDPMANSSPSASFAAYYKLQDSPFTINNLVSTAAFCLGGSYLLTIDNPGNGNNDSPLNYPSLTYNWFRETGPTTAVFVAEGDFLEVSEPGTYFVETNYGSCTSNSFSNRVTVSEVASGEAVAGISSSLGNPFCPQQGQTTLSTLGGISYQWFKDGELINGATDQMLQTDEPGVYSVQVDLGDCSASGSIELESELFDGSLNIPETNFIEDDETLWVQVSTTAINPQYEWYFNNNLIAGVDEDNYVVTEMGNYSVVVTDIAGCPGTREFTFNVSNPFPDVEKIPNVISPNGDSINDTWVLPTKYVSGTNTEVMILTNAGKVVLRTNDYMNNWPENDLNLTAVNKVFYYVITTSDNEVRKGSITVIR